MGSSTERKVALVGFDGDIYKKPTPIGATVTSF